MFVKSKMDFHTVEQNARGAPLMKGKFYRINPDTDDATDVVIEAMQSFKKNDKNLGKQVIPMILMDLAPADMIKILDSEDQPITYPEHEANSLVRALVPASYIVDLKKVIGAHIGGNSIVKANQAFPVHIWFHAANMLMLFHQTNIRLMPFPIEQEEGGIVYQMLAVTMDEYKLYEEVLHYGIQAEGLVAGFATSSKFAYEVIKRRGIVNMSHAEVDQILTHVFLDHNEGVFEGCLFYPLNKFELEHKELIEKYIYTI